MTPLQQLPSSLPTPCVIPIGQRVSNIPRGYTPSSFHNKSFYALSSLKRKIWFQETALPEGGSRRSECIFCIFILFELFRSSFTFGGKWAFAVRQFLGRKTLLRFRLWSERSEFCCTFLNGKKAIFYTSSLEISSDIFRQNKFCSWLIVDEVHYGQSYLSTGIHLNLWIIPVLSVWRI